MYKLSRDFPYLVRNTNYTEALSVALIWLSVLEQYHLGVKQSLSQAQTLETPKMGLIWAWLKLKIPHFIQGHKYSWTVIVHPIEIKVLFIFHMEFTASLSLPIGIVQRN